MRRIKNNMYPQSWHLADNTISIYSVRLLFRRPSGLGIMFLLLMTSGCITANLISEEQQAGLEQLDAEMTIGHLRRDIIANTDPFKRYREDASMEVVATDNWNSTIIRWLTPLDSNVQQFRANLMLYHNGIEFNFLTGDQKGKAIGFDGQSYRYVGSQKNYAKNAASSLYLEPLQSYLEWHHTLMNNPKLKLLGKKGINGNSYWVVYTTEGNTTNLDQYDQFLIYINKNNKRIDYIEFTMRKLMKSYKGVVHYKNYKRVQGILMPFWIGIADDLINPDFDHFFIIESIRFQRFSLND